MLSLVVNVHMRWEVCAASAVTNFMGAIRVLQTCLVVIFLRVLKSFYINLGLRSAMFCGTMIEVVCHY